MRHTTLVLFVACLLFRAAVAANVPDVKELDSAPPDLRRTVLRNWLDLARSHQKESKGAISKDWLPIKQRLMRNASDPELIQRTADIFMAFEEKSPESLTFCHAVLSSSDEKIKANSAYAVSMLVALKLDDNETMNLLVAHVDSGSNAGFFFDVLTQNFAGRPGLTAALKRWTQSANAELKKNASRQLAKPVATTEAVTESITYLIELMKQPETPETLDCCKRFLTQAAQPFQVFAYRQKLNESQVKELLLLAHSKSDVIRFAAIFLISIGAPHRVEELPGTVLAAFTDPQDEKSEILGSLGFMVLPKNLQRELNDTLPKRIKVSRAMACSGLVSHVVRMGGDINWIDQSADQQLHWGPHPAYWAALHNREIANLMPPSKWKKFWNDNGPEKGPRDARYLAFQNICVYPEAPEALWMLEAALGDESFSKQNEVILSSLWCIRSKIKLFEKTKGLHEWLLAKAESEESPVLRMVAAALLYHCFMNKQPLLKAAKTLSSKFEEVFSTWSPIVDCLIEVEPTNSLLEQFHEKLLHASPQAADELSVGSRWYCWLLDAKRGKKPGLPPIDSLATLLCMGSKGWLSSFRDLGPTASSYLDSFRDPFIFFAASPQSPAVTMEFLGSLDYLELAKRHDEK